MLQIMGVHGVSMGNGEWQNKSLMCAYTVKKFIIFPVPSRDVTNQLHYSRPGRVWFVTSRQGTGKMITFFLQCTCTVYFIVSLGQFTRAPGGQGQRVVI
jgi:hypothetical protein